MPSGHEFDLAVQPVTALARPAFHLQHVRLDVLREIICAVLRERFVDRALCAGGVAGLLVREAPDRLKAIVARQFRRPARRQAIGLLEDIRGLAVAEPAGIANPDRQQVGRVRLEQFAPDRDRAVERTRRPGGEGSNMPALALGCRGRACLRGGKGSGDRRPKRRVGGGEQQIALEAMPEDETRVGVEHTADQRHRIGMELEEMLDRPVEEHGGLAAVGRERQAAFVTDHRRCSSRGRSPARYYAGSPAGVTSQPGRVSAMRRRAPEEHVEGAREIDRRQAAI